jgi:hypothetical protein
MRIVLAAAIFFAAMVFNLHPARADDRAPWCAVISVGFGDVVWDCQYNSIEECRPNVIAGNRGFCNHNPRYEPVVAKSKRRAKQH